MGAMKRARRGNLRPERAVASGDRVIRDAVAVAAVLDPGLVALVAASVIVALRFEVGDAVVLGDEVRDDPRLRRRGRREQAPGVVVALQDEHSEVVVREVIVGNLDVGVERTAAGDVGASAKDVDPDPRGRGTVPVYSLPAIRLPSSWPVAPRLIWTPACAIVGFGPPPRTMLPWRWTVLAPSTSIPPL